MKEPIKLGLFIGKVFKSHWILDPENKIFVENIGKMRSGNIIKKRENMCKGVLNCEKKFKLEILPKNKINGGYRAVLFIDKEIYNVYYVLES